MPHTYTNLIYRIVFATKERFPFITSELKPRLYEYLGGTIRGLGAVLLEIGGLNDHIHLLVKLKPTIKFSDFMRELKANSSAWANRITNGRVLNGKPATEHLRLAKRKSKPFAAIFKIRKRIMQKLASTMNLKICSTEAELISTKNIYGDSPG
jgi:REP element-mobilizing transposase RayT